MNSNVYDKKQIMFRIWFYDMIYIVFIKRQKVTKNSV